MSAVSEEETGKSNRKIVSIGVMILLALLMASYASGCLEALTDDGAMAQQQP